MKIRTKFTLWISVSALATAVLASFFVYRELLEEPYKMIDRELFAVANTAISEIDTTNPGKTRQHLEKLDYPVNKYWFKVFDGKGATLFASSLAAHIQFQPRLDSERFFFSSKIPPDYLWVDPGDRDELDEFDEIFGAPVRFRAMVVNRDTPAGPLAMVVAKPIPFFDNELHELRMRLVGGICVTIVMIFLSSCYLSKRLLQPIATINMQVRQIREQSLDLRIPLGKSRDELYELTNALNTMFDRLQHSFVKQKEFVGNAAHELKSPLTVLMLGHEEMLASSPPEIIRQELEKQLTTMRRLNRLIRDLLDISRLEQEEICRRETIRLDRVIRQVIDDFDDLLRARRITVDIDAEEMTIKGDPDKLLRLLVNLIDNAIKYNQPEGGRIIITAARSRELTVLSIANTGPPIPAADLPQIFDQFYRVEKSRSLAYGGSGLGLTIVRRIVELHGGNISAASNEGWTAFTVSLPDPLSA